MEMKKVAIILMGLLALAACRNKTVKEPAYIVQVSLGGWHTPDYTAEQIIGRLDTVSRLIPVKKVIIGWSLEKEIYRQVGAYLHGKDIKMLLWLPVFAGFCRNRGNVREFARRGPLGQHSRQL